MFTAYTFTFDLEQDYNVHTKWISAVCFDSSLRYQVLILHAVVMIVMAAELVRSAKSESKGAPERLR